MPYFLFSFEQLCRLGLGAQRARARLEVVEALIPWQQASTVIYRDGQVVTGGEPLPTYDPATIIARAEALPSDLRLTLHTPLRLKFSGDYIRNINVPALIQAICWRLSVLSAFHGDAHWTIDHRAMVDLARSVTVTDEQVRWVDWERTSSRRTAPQRMNLGGIVGNAVLHDVPLELRMLLVAAELIHVGKACVFGHGRVGVNIPEADRSVQDG